MKTKHFTLKVDDGTEIFVYVWLPEVEGGVKAVVQIAHGMAETAARYERLARRLTEAGYAVYANDHRGHGKTAGTPEKVGILGPDGFNLMTEEMAKLTDRIHSFHKEVPVILFGHSMGSFLTQQYMYRFPDKVNGIILSGSNGPQASTLTAAVWIAKLEARLRGEQHRSKLLDRLSFGAYNQNFRPNRSAFDWLSRDTSEVDAYMQDPFCGVVFTSSFFRDFFKGLLEIHLPENMKLIPKELPVYVFSGDEDPVGGRGKGIRKLLAIYTQLGLQHVSSKLYSGGRHEMLNELNRDEVTEDIIEWLGSIVRL
ncbi:alpha/beta hydrolase [Paenibacillus eucommiae]|uniref:Alpha-beta hydrolase superfamily lysophospholipase n=1 Tax=Paenibacillus eucommiae TaxID=1355755 RepID=A0ABS4J5Z6_9BACL|nr:alpha/beta hydrolase [Paenibacillus eucommiae]MBP1995272.1 alpha-beta hydrolase superfamily lysophospholipase [Paenibacillus eucommiae]